MYKNLKTNLPKEVMAFPDFPFLPKEKSFIEHREVLEYLQRHAENGAFLDGCKRTSSSQNMPINLVKLLDSRVCSYKGLP